MTEGRKRQIIRHEPGPEAADDPHVDSNVDTGGDEFDDYEEDYSSYEANEGLLEKRVYLPLPVILLGFMTIAFMSVALTYVSMNWPEGVDMVFPEYQDMARFEATEEPGQLPQLAFNPEPGVTVGSPSATLSEVPREGASRFAGLEDSTATDTLGKTFQPEATLPTRNPVSDLNPPNRMADIGSVERPAQTITLPNSTPLQKAQSVSNPVMEFTPGKRRNVVPKTRGPINTQGLLKNPEMGKATGIGDPTSLLSLKTRSPVEVKNSPQTTPQKLMQRRYANSVPIPKVELSSNPLLQPVTGAGLETRTVILETATGIEFPVTDMNLGVIQPEGGYSTQAVATLDPKQYTLRKANGLKNPISEMDLGPVKQSDGFGTRSAEYLEPKQYKLNKAHSINEPVPAMTLAERPMIYVSDGVVTSDLQTRSYQMDRAANLSAPVADIQLTKRQADYRGDLEGTETKEATFSTALGLDRPEAIINIKERTWSGNVSALQVPGQKQMNQRYATAVAVPEKQEVPPPPPETRIIPSMPLEDLDPWQRYAAAVPANIEGKGRIVIIIDDMGNNGNMARALGALAGPLNFAFLPYAPNLTRQTREMRAEGHELLVHIPMEPQGNERPGPNALLTSLSDEELLEAIEWNLSQFDGYVGVNNHMGSRFSKDSDGMRIVMETLKARGLLFLDSRTAPNSEGARWAKSLGLPWAGRDIFLDNVVEEAAILAQLKKVEDMARSRGTVIAIGHPHSATLRALQAWIPTLAGKGLVLVPLSSVVEFEGLSRLASATPE